uniref:desulfoferrodoxin family protein n=1 Tax=uncultured Oscillibacter sp. TaxID=876091 RepID=UPI0025D1C1F8
PMTAEHFIQWVVVETERDALIHWFHPGEEPRAVFALAEGQQAKAVYAYCNLHGLWKAEV